MHHPMHQCTQSILGGTDFVESITERFLKGEKDRERPSLKK